jgi:bifunctional aspartokinase / homoserine dehydrogenase 1
MSQNEIRRPLQVMKFGGTSVGDASCISRVVDIVRTAARESSVIVVVSAMNGVTNRLIEAAHQAQRGNESAVTANFARIGKQHDDAIAGLIHSGLERRRLQAQLHDLILEGERLCLGASILRELTLVTLDAIAGLGERLSAPLVAAALAENGIASASVDATTLVVTDSYHGGAEPCVDRTRARCHSRLLPLLQARTVPVVTGFVGATEEGVPTTLGRGGSDYSATILAAALEADEVVIWSDVPGLLTADPRLVPQAVRIPEISFREAAELAYFGAKVLHPKTLRPVTQRNIPVWIKDTFAGHEPGTRITPAVPMATRPSALGKIKALAAICDASLITLAGDFARSATAGVPDTRARIVAAATALRPDLLLISESVAQPNSEIRLVIPSAWAERTVEALHRELSPEATDEPGRRERVEPSISLKTVSVVTLVGQNLGIASGAVARAFNALEQQNIEIIAAVHGSSDCSMSFVVPQTEMKTALAVLHGELVFASKSPCSQPGDGAISAVASPSAIWRFHSEPASAD